MGPRVPERVGGWTEAKAGERQGQEPGQLGPLGAASEHPSFAGEYVVMIRDVTDPPFLGHTLPTAFKHLRVLGKGTDKQPRVPGEGPKSPR